MACQASTGTRFFHSSIRLLHPIVNHSLHLPSSLDLHTRSINSPSLTLRLPSLPRIVVSAAASSSSSSSSPEFLPQSPTDATPPHEILSASTCTLATVFAMALSLSGLLLKLLQRVSLPTNPEQLAAFQSNVVCTMGPLFFASRQERPTVYLNTPPAVVAAGIGKWLDIYNGVLMIRVMLSWFPNVPWERQPLSAIRDLCDPFLNLFRNIIPPKFDTLDVSSSFRRHGHSSFHY